MKRYARALRILLLFVLAAPVAAHAAPKRTSISLWHAYRGNEELALREVVRAFEARTHRTVDLLAVPYEAYAAKLSAAIPYGEGPDLFIDAHERLGSYLKEHLIAPVGDALGDADAADIDTGALSAVTIQGTRYGIPLSNKVLALYLNTALVHDVPQTIEQIAALRAHLPAGTFPLGYDTTNAFYHAPILQAFGARLVDDDGRYEFYGPKAARSVEFIRDLTSRGVLPEEPSDAVVKQLFLSGRVAAVINGPWFATELADSDAGRAISIRVVPLPRIAEAEAAGESGIMRPFLTVETLFVTPDGAARPEARELARWVGGPEASLIRARIGRQVVARRSVWSDAALAHDPLLAAFRRAAVGAIAMPSSPAMRAMWVPAHEAILKILRGDMAPEAALLEAKHRWEDVMRPPPPARSPAPALAVFGALLLLVAVSVVRRVRSPAYRKELRASLQAYRYVAHAVLAVFVLVLMPIFAGAAMSLFTNLRDVPHYVGLANYLDILTARGEGLLSHGSFYFTLLVTVLWTVANVVCHVTLGLALGMLLSRPWLKLRAVYRVLLILPWAVPSYVTALAWRGMFHRQFGAVNAVLRALGLEPVSWFSHFSTAFAANLATNVWLGFPFMMVVTMGALTSIPRDVLEAAEVDGASRWQRFRLVTLPLLKPALLPAVVLGAVWTFNMFNVVFLVSGGEPDGTTDILVSEAYRWAFTRDAQYGYAAAYAVMIFALLALTSRFFAKKLANDEAVL